MAWYAYIAHFFAATFFVNAIPHFVSGVSGHRFQSPFATPPGVGESSPTINVLWGSINAVAGYLLVQVGPFQPGLTVDALVFAVGALVMALMLSRHFGRVRAGVQR